jgi:hypothetical protein
MNHAIQLANRLHRVGLFVDTCTEIDYGYQIRLECGAIINVYSTGKVVVQGKLDPRGKTERVSLLHEILPANTKFPPSMAARNLFDPNAIDALAEGLPPSDLIDVAAFEVMESNLLIGSGPSNEPNSHPSIPQFLELKEQW